MIELGANRYGKPRSGSSGSSAAPTHQVRDLTVAVALEGDFDAAHTDGDNALVIATDTMKNTAYAFAAEHLDGADRGLRPRARRALPRGAAGRARDGQRSASTHWRRHRRRRAAAPDAFVRGGEARPGRDRRGADAAASSSRPASRTSSS